jgi:hypothetical protein
MAFGITNCVRTSKQLHVAQKGLASRYSEIYKLLTFGGSDDPPLNNLDSVTFTSTGPENNDKPIMRTRYPFDKRFICTAITYKAISINVFQMDVEYTGYIGDGLQNDDPPPVSWSRLSRRCSFRNTPVWIVPSSYPTNYAAAWPPTTVIPGSTRVDMMGAPENYRYWHHTLDIEVHLDRTYAQYHDTSHSADYWPIIWNQNLLKRNLEVFLGYPAGTVVFTGYQQALTEDPWDTYTLSFLADEIGHLEQRVIPNVTGGVLMTNVSTWAGKPIKQADAAYFYQPWAKDSGTAGLYDLNLLSPNGVSFEEILNPTPAWTGYP